LPPTMVDDRTLRSGSLLMQRSPPRGDLRDLMQLVEVAAIRRQYSPWHLR